MTKTKVGDAFGMDPALLKAIDWSLAIKRIIHDLRSDFIYAPYLSYIYAKAGEELANVLEKELSAGSFNPGPPLTIEVPKSARMRVAVASKRPGPNFSRPGSILLPRDRLLYQALADQAAPIIPSLTPRRTTIGPLAIGWQIRLAPTCSCRPEPAGINFRRP
jgi:hypothetical protein